MESEGLLVFVEGDFVYTPSYRLCEYFDISHGDFCSDVNYLLCKDGSFRSHFLGDSELGFSISFEGFLYWLLHFGVNLDFTKVRRYLCDFKSKRNGVRIGSSDIAFGDDNFFGPVSFSPVLDFSEADHLVKSIGYRCNIDIISYISSGSSVVYCLLYNN
jgi:hypothetical protein